jgi:plasmid stability protein
MKSALLTTKMEPLWFRVPTITIKGIPRELHRALKSRAKAHHRSLNREVIATLQSAGNDTRHRDVPALIEEARAVRTKFKRPVTAREINSWKRAGRL